MKNLKSIIRNEEAMHLIEKASNLQANIDANMMTIEEAKYYQKQVDDMLKKVLEMAKGE